VENKEHLWRIWSIVVNPLTEWISRVQWLLFSSPSPPPKKNHGKALCWAFILKYG